MKYIKYLFILLFTLVRKVFGLFWFWIVCPFRGYARNVVYNYKLQNGLWLKRLNERNPKLYGGKYHLTGGRTQTGKINYRKISKLEYLFVYWFIWGWLDDDSNYDTCDLGFIQKVITGEHKSWMGKPFKDLLKQHAQIMEASVFGNSFELGDIRAQSPVLLSVSTLFWLMRNTAYNFKYDQYESKEQDFYFELFGYAFGWAPQDIVHGQQNYTLKFFDRVQVDSKK